MLETSSMSITFYQLATVRKLESFLSDNVIDLIIMVIEENFFEDISSIEKLKHNDEYKNLPVIVVDKSPFYIPNNIQLAFESGVTEYFNNKIEKIEFINRVKNQLKIHKRMSEIIEDNKANVETLELMDKLILFMDKADNSFIIFDINGEIEWVNEGFNRLYGYTVDEFKRKFGRTIFDVSKNSEIKKKVDRCIETKRSINYVAECQTRSGEYKWIQTTFTPILSLSGNIERFIAIETDITKLKETEEALNQKNEYMIALTNHLKSANTLLEEQQHEINAQNKAIEEERKKSEELLLNILPFEVARQLKSKGVAKPRNYKNTTVLFLDFVNFTKLTKSLSPLDLVTTLDSYFKRFDDIIESHFIEKIKTIGDAYMCVGGLPLRNRSNPFDMILAGLEMQKIVSEIIEETKTEEGLKWECRIGIHSGSVMAGVVGKKKYIYDIWGHTVNIAARMQEEGESGMVNISGDTYDYVQDYFDCIYRGKIPVKNAEDVDMYFVKRLKPEYSEDEAGLIPNEAFVKILNSL